jgi:hypothetical protein
MTVGARAVAPAIRRWAVCVAPMPSSPALTSGMPDTQLRPDEYDDYKTEFQTSEVMADDERSAPDEDQRPWVMIGMVLLGLFVVALVVAIGVALG